MDEDAFAAGLPVSLGTDAPVIPYSPIAVLYHFITRDTISAGVVGPEQKLRPEEALRLSLRRAPL